VPDHHPAKIDAPFLQHPLLVEAALVMLSASMLLAARQRR